MIPVDSKDAEFTLIQNKKEKTVIFKISDQGFSNWIADQSVSLPLLACVPNDPYAVLWSVTLTPSDINHPVNYTGQDNICFYTKKLFESYQHVIT